MHTKIQIITPDEAQRFLDTKNPHNRPLHQKTVDKYAQEMKSGRWRLNGEAVIFGKSGNLLDGQHRLAASAQAKVPFETVMTLGVPDEFFDTLDDGNQRKLSDVLAIRGEQYGKELAAALYFVYAYATGTFTGNGGAKSKKSVSIPTKQVLERLFETQVGIRNSVKYYWTLKQRPGGLLLPPSLAIGLHYIFSLVDEDRATKFFEQFQSGLELAAGSPIALLRNRLIEASRGGSSKVTKAAQYAYAVATWNSYVSGRKLTRLAFKAEEPLPEIEGVPRSLMKDLL